MWPISMAAALATRMGVSLSKTPPSLAIPPKWGGGIYNFAFAINAATTAVIGTSTVTGNTATNDGDDAYNSPLSTFVADDDSSLGDVSDLGTFISVKPTSKGKGSGKGDLLLGDGGQRHL